MANHNDRMAVAAVKESSLVAVIASATELQRALRLRRLPHFFELRLDALLPAIAKVEREIAKLRVPLVITARHPLEGGMNQLSAAQRADLLLRFLPRAAFVDVELRSAAELKAVLESAEQSRVARILSVHAQDGPQDLRFLHRCAAAARALRADVFKVVVRTDTKPELSELLHFFEDEIASGMPISAMGVGKEGRASRITLAKRGSALNYVHLGTARLLGQISLQEMRRFAGIAERR
ncbi:MAG: type I 3-dehydroquinate dehydratase [Chthoniobacterales bacterium]